MPQETETLLFEVVLNIPQVKEKAEVAQAALARLRKEKAETKKEFDKGEISAQEFGKSMQSITTQISKAQKELNGYNKIIANHEKQQRSADAIIKNLTSSISAAEAELNNLASTEGLAGEKAQQLNARIKSLSDELRAQDAVIDSTRGSMKALDNLIDELKDDYSKLSKAKREDAEVGGRLLSQINSLTKEQEKNQKVVDNSRKGVKEYIRDIDVFGFNIGKTADSFEAGSQGAGVFAKSLVSARGAAIGLMAVPLIFFLVTILAFVTKTQVGMDFLDRKIKGLTITLGVLARDLGEVGQAIYEAFQNPKQAISDLVDFIGNNLLNRIKAFKVIYEGILNLDARKLSDGFIQMGTGVTDASKKVGDYTEKLNKARLAGEQIARVNQQLADEEQKLNLERAKSRAEFERLKKIADDTTRSTKDRIDAANKANTIEVSSTNKLIALQNKKVANMVAEQKLLGKTRENEEAINKERIEGARLEEDIYDRTTELQNTLNSIKKEAAQKAEEYAKRVAEAAVAEAERALIIAKQKGDATIEIEEEVLKRQVALIRAKAAAEKVGADVTIAQKKLIDTKAFAEELEAIKAHARLVEERTFTIQDAQLSARLALVQKGTQAEFDLQSQALGAQLDRQKSDAVDRIKNKKELTAELRRLDARYNADIEQLTQQFEQTQVVQAANLEAQKIQIRQDASEATLSDLRAFDGQRISLEEQTQLKLLEIEKKFAQEKIKPGDTKALEKLEEEFQIRRNAIIAKGAASRRELNRQIDADEIADARARANSRLALSKVGSDEELQARIDAINAEREAALNVAHQTADQKKAINDKANRDIEDAELEHTKRIVGQVLEVYSQATSLASNIINTQIANQSKALDDQQKATLDSAALSAEAREGIERNYQKKKEKLEKEAAEKRKKIALVEAAINTAKAILEAAPNPFLMALAGAVGAIQIGIISSQQFAKGGLVDPNQGGLVHGPSHAQGGIPMYHKSGRYVGEMEGKEIVLTKGVYENPVLRNLASYANQMAGGVALEGTARISANRAPTTYTPFRMAYGGVIGLSQPQPMIQQNNVNLDSINRLVTQSVVNGVAQAVSSMPAPQVQVKDIQSGIGRRVRVERRADQ